MLRPRSNWSCLMLAAPFKSSSALLSVWRKLIKRTFPSNSQIQLGEEGEKIKCLVEILKMMEEPNSYIMDLLEALCEKIPFLPDSTTPTGDVVKFSCPWHQFHSVSLLDFLLLEEVKAVVGSAVQEIKSLKFHQSTFEWPLFSALAARVSRQQGKVTIGGNFCVLLDNTEMALQELASLMKKLEYTEQKWQDISLLTGNLNNADLCARLAKALSTAPGWVNHLLSDRESLRMGKKEDLKKVWDSLGSFWVVSWRQEGKSESKWFYKDPLHEELLGWKELEEMLDKFDME